MDRSSAVDAGWIQVGVVHSSRSCLWRSRKRTRYRSRRNVDIRSGTTLDRREEIVSLANFDEPSAQSRRLFLWACRNVERVVNQSAWPRCSSAERFAPASNSNPERNAQNIRVTE